MSKPILSYSKHGEGKPVLFLFHGFGQDRHIYDSWLPFLKEKFTVIALDLFYHGKSTRPYGPLSKEEWKDNFNEILIENEIDRFSILGFSLGGRFAVATAFAFEDRLEDLYLLAPDAIYLTPWFHAATSFPFKYFFKYFMLRPKKMDALVEWCLRVGIISSYMGDFVKRELGTNENKKRVYISWNHFKTLGYSKKEINRQFRTTSYNKTLVLGTKDIVIPPHKILPILEGCDFQVIEKELKHHQIVKEPIGRELFG